MHACHQDQQTDGQGMECFVKILLLKIVTGLFIRMRMTMQTTFTTPLNLPDPKMPVAIVTGGNKGIGLGVVGIYLSI